LLAHSDRHVKSFRRQVHHAWCQVKVKADAGVQPGKFRNMRCQVDIGEIHRQRGALDTRGLGQYSIGANRFACVRIFIFICKIARMKFTWHEPKRQTNLKAHGFDFCDAEQVFHGATATVEDKRDCGGEQRFNTTGLLGVTVVVITHTETDDEIHIISMREAENHETRKFFANL